MSQDTSERATSAGITKQARDEFLRVAKAAGIGPKETVLFTMDGGEVAQVAAWTEDMRNLLIYSPPPAYTYQKQVPAECTHWQALRQAIDAAKPNWGTCKVQSDPHPPLDPPTRVWEADLPEDFAFGLMFTAPGINTELDRPILIGTHVAPTEEGAIGIQTTDTVALCTYTTKPTPDTAASMPKGGMIIPPHVCQAVIAAEADRAMPLRLKKGRVPIPFGEPVTMWGIAIGDEWEIWFRPIEGQFPNTQRVLFAAEEGSAFFYGPRKHIAQLCQCIAQVKRGKDRLPCLRLSPQRIVGGWGLEDQHDGPFWSTENPLEFCGGPDTGQWWLDPARLLTLLEVPEHWAMRKGWKDSAGDVVSIAITSVSGSSYVFNVSFCGLPQARRLLCPRVEITMPDGMTG